MVCFLIAILNTLCIMEAHFHFFVLKWSGFPCRISYNWCYYQGNAAFPCELFHVCYFFLLLAITRDRCPQGYSIECQIWFLLFVYFVQLLEAYVFVSWKHFFCPCRLVEKNHKEVASVASLPGISSLAIRANRDLVMEFLFSLHYREVLVYRLWSSFVLQWWGFLMWCCYLLMIDRS